jgi:hypothetical protein
LAHPEQRFDDAPRRERGLGDLDPERRERVVHRVGDRRRRRDGAAFADALLAEAGVGRGRLEVVDAHRGHLGGARQQIVRERGGERLALRVERHFLVERGADALRRAAVNLAVDDHRVHERAAVLDDHVIEDLDLAGLGVDCDARRVARVAEGAGVDLGLVARGRFESRRIDVGREELRLAVPDVRDFGEGQPTVGSLHADKTVLKDEVGSRNLQES